LRARAHDRRALVSCVVLQKSQPVAATGHASAVVAWCSPWSGVAVYAASVPIGVTADVNAGGKRLSRDLSGGEGRRAMIYDHSGAAYRLNVENVEWGGGHGVR
jgi:hypothetical protein